MHSRSDAVVLACTGRLVGQVRTQEARLRRDLPDSVHQMRVATRRLRSVLSVYGPLFERRVTRSLRDELAWLAAELGTARDAEVMLASFRSDMAGESRLLTDGAVPDAITSELSHAYRRAHDRVLDDLDTERYRRLLVSLETFVADPPVRKRAAAPADRTLPALVSRSYDRVRRRIEEARARPPGSDRDELLHDARKAAKRARDAAEGIAPVFGSEAASFAAAMEAVQSALGEHNDSVLTRDRLHDLALHTTSTQAAFLYGRLHARAEARDSLSQDHIDAAWEAAGRKSVRRWLR